ncbi:MAG: hypothetical protein AAB927_00070 [Patescibacteria group bacterium]
MDGEFILTQGAGQKLEFAINRNGGGIVDIEWLSAGDNFKQVMLLARESGTVVKKPTLVFIKQTLLGDTPITVFGLGGRLTIGQMLRTSAKVAPNASFAELEKSLKEGKRPIPSSDCEVVLDKQAKFFLKQEGGEDFGLRDDGWANLILVVNPDGSLSVVYAYWFGDRWSRGRFSLDRGGVWAVGRRLVLGNSDALSI